MIALLLAALAQPLFTDEIGRIEDLGVELEATVFRLRDVARGSLAEKAGLQAGDEITHCGGRAVACWSELVEELRAAPADIELALKYRRPSHTVPRDAVVRLLEVPEVKNEERLYALKASTEKIEVGGARREYELLVPRGFSSEKKAPLLVLLHGTDSSPFYVMASWAPLARREAILAAPRKAGGRWAGEEVFVLGVVEEVMKNRPVDPARVYVAGHSSGGGFAMQLVMKRGDLFAAAAGFAGGVGPVDGASDRKPPLLFYAGEKDRLGWPEFPALAGPELRRAGYSLRVVIEKGGTRGPEYHDLNDRGCAVVWEWLKRQRKQ